MTKKTKHRHWRIKILRKHPRCMVCGAIKNREAHHLNDASHHPNERYDIDNGVTLCRNHHTMFHTVFMYGFRSKCVAKDYYDFIEMIDKLRLEFQEEMILKIKGI